MREHGFAQSADGDCLKWLRFYLDFCAKYRHPAEDRERVEPFLQKLAEKGQSPDSQKRAAASVPMYHALVAGRPEGPEGDT
jgi:hypothetical protein